MLSHVMPVGTLHVICNVCQSVSMSLHVTYPTLHSMSVQSTGMKLAIVDIGFGEAIMAMLLMCTPSVLALCQDFMLPAALLQRRPTWNWPLCHARYVALSCCTIHGTYCLIWLFEPEPAALQTISTAPSSCTSSHLARRC